MNANAEYAKYLKTDQWREVSDARKQMDGHACVCCGSKEHIAAHHVVYPGKWSDTTTDHLVTLCKGCHTAVHRIQEKIDSSKPSWEKGRASAWVTYQAARIVAVECWRHNAFSTADVARYSRAVCEIIYKSGREIYSPIMDALEIMATAKDCLIVNSQPTFDKTKRDTRRKSKTRFK